MPEATIIPLGLNSQDPFALYQYNRTSWRMAGVDDWTAPPGQNPDMLVTALNVLPPATNAFQRRWGYSIFSPKLDIGGPGGDTNTTPLLRQVLPFEANNQVGITAQQLVTPEAVLAGSLILVFFYNTPAVATGAYPVTDSHGNTYTQVQWRVNLDSELALFWALNTTPGHLTVTIACTGTTFNICAGVAEIIGASHLTPIASESDSGVSDGGPSGTITLASTFMFPENQLLLGWAGATNTDGSASFTAAGCFTLNEPSGYTVHGVTSPFLTSGFQWCPQGVANTGSLPAKFTCNKTVTYRGVVLAIQG